MNPVMTKMLLPALIAGFLTTSSASAMTKDDVTMPNSKKVAGKTLVLNGMGTRKATIFNVHVYVAGLYVEAKSKDSATILKAEGPRQLVLQFVRDVSAEDIAETIADNLSKSPLAKKAHIKQNIKTLSRVMKPIKEGQQLTFTYLPASQSTQAHMNGRKLTDLPTKEFSDLLFGGWLAPTAPAKKLRKGLLGL